MNGILTLSDGRPFTIGPTDRASTGGGPQRRARTASAIAVPDGFDQTLDALVRHQRRSPSQRRFTHGNCGYNTVRGPSVQVDEPVAVPLVPLGEARRLEFRLETFNLFNWVNFDFPGASVSNLNTFGQITSTLGDPREMQLAVKFYF